MVKIEWDNKKNEFLKKERNISFEIVVKYISEDKIIDILNNPNEEMYSNQKILLINHKDYIYYVPYVENDGTVFLKTIIPSRKLTKKYLGGKNENK